MAFFNTLALSFFFLLSSGSSTLIPPTSSAHVAAKTLRNRGYSLFASTIDSTNTNFDPPDFIFTAKILTNRPSPPRPSSVLLNYHTLNTPLTWINLLSNTSSIGGVHIKQPDIYVDDRLTVHGIDGVLDPTSAMKCFQVQIQSSHQDHRSFLDHAIRALRRRRRFTVAATALTLKRQEMLSLTSVTLFVPSDMALFSNPDGFRHHVVPKRYRFGDLVAKGGVVFETIDPNKTLVVDFVDGFVTVNGVIVNRMEAYRNRWIVVLSVSMSLDDAGNLVDSGSFAPSPAPAGMEIRYPDEIINGFNASVESPSPETVELPYPDEIINRLNTSVQSTESPSPATMDVRYSGVKTNCSTTSVQFPSPSPATMDVRYSDVIIDGFNASIESPSPSPAKMESNMNDSRCVFGIPAGMEGGDLLCPASGVRNRNLQEEEDLIDAYVAVYPPLDVKDQADEV